MFDNKQSFVNAFLGNADPYTERRKRFIYQGREKGVEEVSYDTVKRAYWMSAAIRFDDKKYYLIPNMQEMPGMSFEQIMAKIHDQFISTDGDYKTVRFYKIKT